VSQDLDLVRLARILGMTGSDRDGESANAGRKATAMIRAAGMEWSDFVGAAERAARAEEGARYLLAENDELRAALARAEASNGAVAWQDVSVASSTNHRVAAKWALDLHREGDLAQWV
jgi:hypothetical protein